MKNKKVMILIIFVFLIILAYVRCSSIMYFKIPYESSVDRNTPRLPNKFFTEVKDRPHLDLKYGKNTKTLNFETLKQELTGALDALASLARQKRAKITIMHGSLIGYYFNKQILPWDDDIDVIVVGEEDILALASLDGWESKDFIFKVNPNFINKNTNDHLNKIDARMISKNTGIFIDLTFFWKSENTHFAKDGHQYSNDMLFPLAPAVFCGIDVFVPNDIPTCLTKEYGPKVLNLSFKHKGRLWEFDGSKWI